MSVYADAVLDVLDPNGYCSSRLYREHCTLLQDERGPIYTKDLSKIGRYAENAILIDNSPDAYIFQPEQAIPITSWYDDYDDKELLDLIPILIKMSKIPDIRVPIQ
jgi:RNA polymerase II subunit A small phosphatase-like protein